VRFPFGSLQVQQGFVSLTSENPYHPQLSVSAISTQFGYEIDMQVSGTADAPVVQFSSNPPLSSEQILLLLSAGELPQGTFSLTPQQRAQTLAMFLGRDALAQLGFGDATEQRLTVHSGEQISQTGTPTYSIEFKLSDQLSLVGEYDRFGDYNAGVKWRIYSK
jgi:translocation and assembly module TamB